MSDSVTDLAGRGVIVTAAGGSIESVFGLVEFAGAAMPKPILDMTTADWVTGEVTDVNGGSFID